MQITFDDETYEFDLEAIDRSEAAYIYRQTELTVGGLLKGLSDIHPVALDALYWLMLKQNGQVRDIHKLPNYPVLKFAEAIIEAFDAEEKAQKKDEEADPTEAAIAAAKT
jgi:hypothetical protein